VRTHWENNPSGAFLGRALCFKGSQHEQIIGAGIPLRLKFEKQKPVKTFPRKKEEKGEQEIRHHELRRERKNARGTLWRKLGGGHEIEAGLVLIASGMVHGEGGSGMGAVHEV